MKTKLSAEDRKTQVLMVARSLFAKQGFDKTTLDDIANKAGISRPRVIQLFGSKQKLYEEIAVTAYKNHPMDKDLEEPMRQKDDLGVLRAFAVHVLMHTQKRVDRENLKILMAARLKEDRFHKTHFHAKDALMISRLEDYFAKRAAEGAFKDIDSKTIVYAYQAMVTNLGIYKNVMNTMEFVDIEELCLSCARIFMYGIAKDE